MSNDQTVIQEPRTRTKCLGRLPGVSNPKMLHLSRFLKKAAAAPPPSTTAYWNRRAPFPLRDFGNIFYGDCTIASQANGAGRMERIEAGRTPSIADNMVVQTYLDLTQRLYGGGDVGANMLDALDNWRRANETFKDTQGRALTIDAYVRVNAADQQELRQAIWTAGAHGIYIGLSLPIPFQDIVPPAMWDVPVGQKPINDWEPGAWGGHAMWARSYDSKGIQVVHSWDLPDQTISWRAVGYYVDEAYVVIDSMDAWRKNKLAVANLNLPGIVKAVNAASSVKIK